VPNLALLGFNKKCLPPLSTKANNWTTPAQIESRFIVSIVHSVGIGVHYTQYFKCSVRVYVLLVCILQRQYNHQYFSKVLSELH
jgi:hypothetical protein